MFFLEQRGRTARDLARDFKREAVEVQFMGHSLQDV